MELNEIKYRFVIDLTKFFVGKYNDGEIKDLNLIIRNVKSLSNFVKEMSFVYDESIWFPDKPETHKNLIEFKHPTKYLHLQIRSPGPTIWYYFLASMSVGM